MPCEAVVDYLKFTGLACQVKTIPTTSFSQHELKKHTNCVIGIGYGKSFAWIEWGAGLKHWVYVNKDGKLCNWGKATDLNNSSDKPDDLQKFTHVYHVIQL